MSPFQMQPTRKAKSSGIAAILSTHLIQLRESSGQHQISTSPLKLLPFHDSSTALVIKGNT